MKTGLFLLKLFHNVMDIQTNGQSGVYLLLCFAELVHSKNYYGLTVALLKLSIAYHFCLVDIAKRLIYCCVESSVECGISDDGCLDTAAADWNAADWH